MTKINVYFILYLKLNLLIHLTGEDIFLTTKLPPCAMRPEHVQKYIKESLAALQVDYVDLYLVHVPIGMKNVEGTLYPTLEDGTVDFDMTTDHVAIWKVKVFS